MAPQAFTEATRLFPGRDNVDNSGVANEVYDSAPEQSADFSSAIATSVNSGTGFVTSKEAEEAEVEEQLVAAVVPHANASIIPAVEATGALLFEIVLLCSCNHIVRCRRVSTQRSSSGAGGVIRERARGGIVRKRGGVHTSGGGRGRAETISKMDTSNSEN